MSETETTGAATDAAPSAESSEFLTKEELRDVARFTFKESVLDIPELGGKVLLRALSVGERNSLTSRLPDDPTQWQLKHTGMSLAAYVVNPEETVDWWTETIKPWPARALDRINRQIMQVINLSIEEENAAGVEFPGTDV